MICTNSDEKFFIRVHPCDPRFIFFACGHSHGFVPMRRFVFPFAAERGRAAEPTSG
jgi:hypothetical protein